MSSPPSLAHAQAFLTYLLTCSPPPYDSNLLPLISLTHATDGPTPTLTCRLTISAPLLNVAGALHGGATATLFDLITTLALSMVRREGFWETSGVSRSLKVTYLEALTAGEEVEVQAEVVRVGGRMAFLRGVMRRLGGQGRVVATCEHEKVDPLAGRREKL